MNKKTALITGGSRGIGFGIATELANLGYDLAINGVRPESDAAENLNLLRSKGIKVVYCPGNIADSVEREQIVNKAFSELGPINLLVNNAGVAPKVRMDMLEVSEDSFDYVLGTNLKGTYFLTQLVARKMIEHKNANPDFEAQMVNITSISANTASPMRGEYCISKAGLSMLSQLFALKMSEYDIPVYEIRPGVISTDMTAVVKDKYDKQINDGLTLTKRWGTPEDIGKAVGSIASGGFPYATGQIFVIDGGLTMLRF